MYVSYVHGHMCASSQRFTARFRRLLQRGGSSYCPPSNFSNSPGSRPRIAAHGSFALDFQRVHPQPQRPWLDATVLVCTLFLYDLTSNRFSGIIRVCPISAPRINTIRRHNMPVSAAHATSHSQRLIQRNTFNIRRIAW